MENYSWGLYLWPLLFFLIVFGVFLFRGRSRDDFHFRTPYQGNGMFYPYTPRRLGRRRERRTRSSRRSDSRIVEDVNGSLLAHDDLDASEIIVSAEDGILTLSGTVSSFAERSLAEDLVGSVLGVSDVKNELNVEKQSTQDQDHVA